MSEFSEYYKNHGMLGGASLLNNEMFDNGGFVKPTMEELIERISSLSKKSKDELAELTEIPKTNNLELWYPKVAAKVYENWNTERFKGGRMFKILKKLNSEKDEEGQKINGTWGDYEAGKLVTDINELKLDQIILIKQREGATRVVKSEIEFTEQNTLEKINKGAKRGLKNPTVKKIVAKITKIETRKYASLSNKHITYKDLSNNFGGNIFTESEFMSSIEEYNSSGADAVLVYFPNDESINLSAKESIGLFNANLEANLLHDYYNGATPHSADSTLIYYKDGVETKRTVTSIFISFDNINPIHNIGNRIEYDTKEERDADLQIVKDYLNKNK